MELKIISHNNKHYLEERISNYNQKHAQCGDCVFYKKLNGYEGQCLGVDKNTFNGTYPCTNGTCYKEIKEGL